MTESKIAKAILEYKLSRGGEGQRLSLDKALTLLAEVDSITVKNPTKSDYSDKLLDILPTKIVAMVNFGRSGTGLFHSLIDSHPEVSTLPSIYFSEYFDHSVWIRIISSGWNGMVDRFMSIYEVLFDASSSVPIESKSKKLIHNIGIKEGMTTVGDKKNEILSVDKKLFSSELKRLMDYHNEMDAFLFFKLVTVAYNKAINDCNPKHLIFYHIHNPDTYAKLNFIRFSQDTKWIMIVREPIQSCESWVRESFIAKDYFGVVNRIVEMLFEVDSIVYNDQRSIGVRLEDLKEYPRKTIPALCKWMGIEENESLYKMTVQGKKWWGDPGSPDYSKDGMEPFGKTSINRKIGSVFSEKDQFILRTLFYPFSARFGYVQENSEKFGENLKAIRPLLGEMFDFEKKIAGSIETEYESFVETGPYLYFRSSLLERWKTLTNFGTYPNMIKCINSDD